MRRKRTSGTVASIAILVGSALALCIVTTPAVAKALTAKQIANKVLKRDPQKPADIDLFTSKFDNDVVGFYPQGKAMTPASGPVLTEAQVRTRLRNYLQDQFPGDSAKVNAALALFDDPDTKSLIPEAPIRAAVVGMKGTLLQPTISLALNSGIFTLGIRYGGVPGDSVIASSFGAPQRSVLVNRTYSSEDFRYLIGVMGHEFLHHDNGPLKPREEEEINNALTAMTYLQVLSKHPELAYKGTELSRFMNAYALAFLNSHEKGSPNSEIFAPTGTGIAPGSPSNAPDFWMWLARWAGLLPNQTPASAALGQITKSLGLPKATKFSLATAKTFANLNDNWLSDVGRVQIEVLLQMLSVRTIADKANLTRSKIISKLHLRPYLDSIR